VCLVPSRRALCLEETLVADRGVGETQGERPYPGDVSAGQGGEQSAIDAPAEEAAHLHIGYEVRGYRVVEGRVDVEHRSGLG